MNLRLTGEEQLQVAVVNYLKAYYPNIKFTISPITKLSIYAGLKQKTMGYTKGTPDLIIFKPNSKYHGILIEFKFGKNKTTPEQLDFQAYLNQNGYYAITCYSYQEAKKEIDNYMRCQK